jgi:hypothetical protein
MLPARMRSRWAAVNDLLGELRDLRDHRRALEARLTRASVAEVDRLIERAAGAVDETFLDTAPEANACVFGACEAIVVAREQIEALTATCAVSSRIVVRSRALRQRAARRLYRQIQGEPPSE